MPFHRKSTARCCCPIRACSSSPCRSDDAKFGNSLHLLLSPACAGMTGEWDRLCGIGPRYRRMRMLEIAGRMGVLGTETAFEVLARANALAAQGRSIINLGIGQPDFPTPEHIVEAGRKALADGHHGYTTANGIPPLRAAVAADLFRRHRVEVSPELVLVVPGGKVTMFFAILMFGEPG